MTLLELISIVAGLALGACLGWFLERSDFSLFRVLMDPRPRAGRDALYAYAFALGLGWLAMGISTLLLPGIMILPLPAGFAANALGGITAGAAVRLIGACPLAFSYGAGATRLPALAVFAGWCAGLILGMHGPFSAMLERLRELGPADFALAGGPGVPRWAAFLALGAFSLFWLMRAPVRVAPGVLEWPKQGAILAMLGGLGWLLALHGGDFSGMNGVQAMEDVFQGLAGGPLWLRPSLLLVVGMTGWAFFRALWRRRLFAGGIGSPPAFIFLVLAGALLGLACALAGGDPAAHAFFGMSALGTGSAVFMLAFWLGGRLTSALDSGEGR